MTKLLRAAESSLNFDVEIYASISKQEQEREQEQNTQLNELFLSLQEHTLKIIDIATTKLPYKPRINRSCSTSNKIMAIEDKESLFRLLEWIGISSNNCLRYIF